MDDPGTDRDTLRERLRLRLAEALARGGASADELAASVIEELTDLGFLASVPQPVTEAWPAGEAAAGGPGGSVRRTGDTFLADEGFNLIYGEAGWTNHKDPEAASLRFAEDAEGWPTKADGSRLAGHLLAVDGSMRRYP
jgi:hypothetical protein